MPTPLMPTIDRISTPEVGEHASREPGRAAVALMIAILGVTTAVWILGVVVVAGWLISGIL
jgi:hypothetical protein